MAEANRYDCNALQLRKRAIDKHYTSQHRLSRSSVRSCHMATETKTKSEVEVLANAKCIALIEAIDKGTAEVASKKVNLAKVARSESDRLGYDENECRKMLALSWREARKFKSSDESLQAAFDQTARPDVSKIMRLAYPISDEASKALDRAIAHNEKVGASRGRIGENRLLDVARGNLTFDDAKAGKSKERTPRVSALDANMPPVERFGNALAALIGQYKSKVTLDEMEKVFTKAIAERKEIGKS